MLRLNRRSFIKGLAALTGSLMVAQALPDEVKAAVEELPPAVEPHPTTVDAFVPDIWRNPWQVHNRDICAEHGCRVWSEYMMTHLANAIIHLDPVTNKYSAFMVEDYDRLGADRLRDRYLERMTRGVHRPAVRHGRPYPKVATGGRDYSIGTDSLLHMWQQVDEQGFMDQADAPLMLVGAETFVGLLKNDAFVVREYDPNEENISVWGYKDASPVGAVFGLPVARSIFVKGDLAVVRSTDRREIELNLLSLGRRA